MGGRRGRTWRRGPGRRKMNKGWLELESDPGEPRVGGGELGLSGSG